MSQIPIFRLPIRWASNEGEPSFVIFGISKKRALDEDFECSARALAILLYQNSNNSFSKELARELDKLNNTFISVKDNDEKIRNLNIYQADI